MTKNFKGGYKIVSLNGNDLASGDSFVVNGLYENLVNSYKKPILVTEIVIDGEKQQDSFAVVKQSDGGYKIDVYDYALTVTSEDSVSAVALPEITSIGEGLDLTDGELSSTGGSKLYLHFFYISAHSDSTRIYFQCISKSESDTFKDIMENIRTNSTGEGIFSNGLLVATGNSTFGNQCIIYSIAPTSETAFVIKGTKSDYYVESKTVNYTDINIYTHKVIEL